MNIAICFDTGIHIGWGEKLSMYTDLTDMSDAMYRLLSSYESQEGRIKNGSLYLARLRAYYRSFYRRGVDRNVTGVCRAFFCIR